MSHCIDPRFFDLEIYSIYKAVNEVLGDETWNIVWRAGEILLNDISKEIGIDAVDDPFKALESLAKWLKKVGYISDIEVRKTGEDTVEYIMADPVITPGAKRLIEEGMVPPHISTALMFATLKRFGLKAEMIGDPIFLDDGRVIEKWRLVKAD